MSLTPSGIIYSDTSWFRTLEPGESYNVHAPQTQSATWNILERIEVEVEPDPSGTLVLQPQFWTGAPPGLTLTLQAGEDLHWGFRLAGWPTGAYIRCSNPAGSGGNPVTFQIVVYGKHAT